jgi:acyl-CoA synthetase (AMP-forming)/AMP-acid ligase II
MKTPPSPAAMLQARAADAPDRVVFTHLSYDGAEPQTLTYGALYRRAAAVASRLAADGLRGRPVLLVYRPGPEFAPAFFGALMAGAIAVPVPVPQFSAQYARLEGIAGDCVPGAVLTTSALATSLAARFEAGGFVRGCRWLSTDTLEPTGDFDSSPAPGSNAALLQYTSGSTSEPRGVAVTHDNLAHNVTTIVRDLPVPGREPAVAWLPHFHDMGLMAGIVTPIYRDCPSVLMAPVAFLQRPLRWLEAITRYRAQTSGAPNFAYALLARAAADAGASELDLSSWEVAYVGAEPVRASTLAAFAARFEPYGFRAAAFTPCYGMAEATLLVTSKRRGSSPKVYSLSRAELEAGRALASSEPGAALLTGCGHPVSATDIQIVDPGERVPLPRGRVGEIWVAGPQVARGYWRASGDDPFDAVLAGGGGPFLRTGDLGFLSEDGELVFVDRLKDLLIVNGQNHACHDLELTAGTSHPLVSADGCVACSVERDDAPRVTLIAEIPAGAVDEVAAVARAMRAAVFSRHALALHTIAFVAPRKLSRTTSGKLQRRLTAARLAAGDLRVLALDGELPALHPSTSELELQR